MIRVGIQFAGEEAIRDTLDEFGFIYISSDNILAPEVKSFERTEYAEEEGEHILPFTVDAAFDYKVNFLIQSDSIENANAKIAAFNQKLYTETGGTKAFSRITLHNYHKGVKIVGYPRPMSQASRFWRDPKGVQQDAVEAELLIRVDKPSLCNFNYKSK